MCIGNAEDKNVPTLVQGLAGHKIVGVELGSGDAHTLALEDNGNNKAMLLHKLFACEGCDCFTISCNSLRNCMVLGRWRLWEAGQRRE